MNTGGSSRESCCAVHVHPWVEEVQNNEINALFLQCTHSGTRAAPTFNIRNCPSPSLPAGEGGVQTTPSEHGEMITTCTVYCGGTA